MGLFNEVHRIFIARPDFAKDALVYKHPDTNIRKGTELTVAADEAALFVRDGKVQGVLAPGRHTLSTDNIPFLGMLIDAATGGNLYISEIFFVTTREVPDVKFGGPVGDLQDPQTQLIVSAGVYGEFSVRITNPEQFVVGIAGLRQTTNQEVLAWFKQIFLRTVKGAVAELIVKKNWPLLQVTSGAYTEEISEDVIKRAATLVDKYGISIVNVANFTVSVRDEDLAQLKTYARDTAMSKMAGGYQNYAMGEGMMRGGPSGSGSSPMDMVGMAMAQQMLKNMQGSAPSAPAPASPAPAAAAADPMDVAKARLAKLKELLKDDLISQAEFDTKKKEILSSL
jgi:membrane protease subunit (stomatin/prohibitin family)